MLSLVEWQEPVHTHAVKHIFLTQRLDLGLKAQFWQEDLQIALRVADRFRGSSPDVSTHTNRVRQVYNNYRDNRCVTRSLQYRMETNRSR